MSAAEELFEKVFIRFTRGWNAINALREAAEVGLPTAEHKLLPGYLDFVETLTRPQSPGDAPILTGVGKEGLALIASETARGIVRSAQAGVNAAIAVFAHSVVDAAAFGYCKVSRFAEPEAWVQVVEKRGVELGLVRGQTYETLRDTLLDTYFEQLERESLLKKVDLLHARCPPAAEWPSYKFDRKVLLRLDALRHDIIHGDALLKQVPNFGLMETDYLMRTCWYFLWLVNKSDLRLDPAAIMKLGDTPKPPPAPVE